jgi:hypothetical protein
MPVFTGAMAPWIRMEGRKPRNPRSPVAAAAEVFDLQTGQTIAAKTSDLSVGGCYLPTAKPLPVRTAVRLQLSHNGSKITIFGDVVRSEPGKGMALKFRTVEPSQLDILKRWFFSLDRYDE